MESHMIIPNRNHSARGITTILVVAFMGVLLIILGTITSYALEQAKYGRALYGREQALHIAEAGLEYYRWFLAHSPNNLTNGTGLPGPYTYTVNDPEGGQIGEASLSVTGNSQCGVVQNIDITSRGTSDQNPSFQRTLLARYMRASVAEYAFILNTNIWFGPTNEGVGPYFSNGGIRMDGTNNSTVASALSSWQCDSTYGCSPTQSKPGVWGDGEGSALWQYPVSSIDFAGMATNFNTIKGYAQSNGMYFYDSSVAGHDYAGYHIILNSSGTFDVYKVTNATAFTAYHIDDGQYHSNYDAISRQTYVGRYTPPSTCSVIYAQGNVWLEGTLSGKLTIVAADPGSYAPNIILANNISYATTDGTTGLTAIAEHSVRIPLNSPDTMNIRGIFVAQTGYYGRDYYIPNSYGSTYNPYVVQSNLNLIGTIVSTQRPVACWGSGSTCDSGYNNRTTNYDRILAFDPPPFTPATSPDYHFVLWREQ
jgi:hypothetical protein